MNPISHRSAGIRLEIACAALLAAAAVAPSAYAEQVTKSFAVSGRANVRVETNDGSVGVTSGDAKQVEFRVEYQGYELGKTLRVDSRQNGDKVELTARVTGHWGISFGHNLRHLRIEVRMPREADLQVETGNGPVQAESINGTVNVHTGDGSVKANSLNGTIDLHTNDGSITVANLKGDMRLRTGDGSIDARDLDGKVEADSGDGHIRITGRFDALDVKTGDGSVDTRVQPGSKMVSSWTIRTGDGSVDLVLPSDFRTNIDVSTGDGHISMGIPVTVEGTFSNSQQIHGKMNGGGQPLTIHTGDGSIRLSKS
jgi:DUF4097 and DUF4098 domain-containing protein YvlB